MNWRLSRLMLLACLVGASLVAEGRAEDKEKKGFIGIQIRGDKDSGKVLITGVIDGSPAQKAGLQAGDVLLKVGTVKADNLQTVVKFIASLKPKEKVVVRVDRDGQEKDIQVTVGERDPVPGEKP